MWVQSMPGAPACNFGHKLTKFIPFQGQALQGRGGGVISGKKNKKNSPQTLSERMDMSNKFHQEMTEVLAAALMVDLRDQ